MCDRDKWAIIGAGNGGQALAAYFAMKGKEISVYDAFQNTVDRLNELGAITLDGDIEGTGKIGLASTDMEKVINDASVIWVVLPSIYHSSIAVKMAPHLKDGQIVILSPVAALGTMEFMEILKQSGSAADIILAGACTLLFACRMKETGKVTINGKKDWLTIAAYPASRNEKVKEQIAEYVPEYEFVDNIIRVFLDNKNYAVHPGPTLLYAAMIEKGFDFEYYIDMGDAQVKLAEAIDRESIEIAEAYGIEGSLGIAEFFKKTYGYEGGCFRELLNTAECYKGISGPHSLSVRYLQEDVPYALKGIQMLGKIAGVSTPAIDSVVGLAYVLKGDELDEGRTFKSTGLSENITVKELLSMC